jgi:hypothetical protein
MYMLMRPALHVKQHECLFFIDLKYFDLFWSKVNVEEIIEFYFGCIITLNIFRLRKAT